MKIDVDLETLKTICRHAHSDAAALEFALEWAERAEKLALKMQEERDALREAAQAVVAERRNVDSAYHLFAKVNVLKLSALAALLPNTGGE